jgi:hypothetical protein
MNATLREVLARRADEAGDPDLDLDELVRLGEHRLRRRRLAAVLSSAGAVLVVIALAIGVAVSSPTDRGRGPVDRPTPDKPVRKPVVRKVVYSDAPLFSHATGSVHFGDRVVTTDDGSVHLDVTDQGFVYTTRGGRVWFSDGGTPQQVGTACGASPNGAISTMATGMVVTASSGPYAAWFDCSHGARGELVVYDTRSLSELTRTRTGFCRPVCTFAGWAGEHVYLDRGVYRGSPTPQFSVDVSTGRVRPATGATYAQEVRSLPRGVVVGDTSPSGSVTSGIGVQFRALDGRLLAWWRLPNGEQVLTRAYDTGTGQVLRLRLPDGYRAAATEDFTVFEWLDDETVALVSGGLGDGYGTLFTCRLPEGRCDVAATPPTQAAGRRIVAQLPLPG